MSLQVPDGVSADGSTAEVPVDRAVEGAGTGPAVGAGTGPGAGAGAPAGRLGRRSLLALAATSGTAAVVGGGLALRSVGGDPDPGETRVAAPATAAGVGLLPASAADVPVPFRGTLQAGIVTAVQDRMQVAAFDVLPGTSKGQLANLLQTWTTISERMTQGLEAFEGGALGGVPEAAPSDTGEALDLPPSRLTVTVGFGASLFDTRFGLGGRKPDALVELPRFPGDELESNRSRGDLVVQVCADDQQVASHVVRMLSKTGFGVVRLRWNQLGYAKTSMTTPQEQTPRNLFGFKDGTRNILVDQTEELDRYVWVPKDSGPAWLAGGTYLVARRIRMLMEIWDRTSLQEQEEIIGRTKGEGAPIGQLKEKDDVRPELLPPLSHVALMHSSNQAHGSRVLRRGYSFIDGSDELGRLDAGLFFIGFVRDPVAQLGPMLREMATKDVLALEYLRTTSSGVYAVPPGLAAGEHWGEALFG